MGTFGICLCGKPHWLRDLIRLLARSAPWRRGITALLAGYALLGFGLGAWHLLYGG
jgi:hypothetical protein